MLRNESLSFYFGKKKAKAKEELRKGSLLLEGLISATNGIYNPIRFFSFKEIQLCKNNFVSYCHEWYKGTLDDRPVLVKIHFWYPTSTNHCEASCDIVTSIQMSNHNNVLKLIGCCLEFQNRILLVFEDAEMRPLGDLKETLSWKMRLKVAKDLAHAITYLHTAFSKPIIHRNITSHNVLLDKDCVAKLADFSMSISIPEGETHVLVERISASCAYSEPEYLKTSYVSEKSDVYSFGVLLLFLLTGQSLLRACFREVKPEDYMFDMGPQKLSIRSFFIDKPLDEIVDPKIWKEEGGISQEERLKLQAFLQLALRCIEYKSIDRPFMIEVAKELWQIERSVTMATNSLA